MMFQSNEEKTETARWILSLISLVCDWLSNSDGISSQALLLDHSFVFTKQKQSPNKQINK